MRLPTWQNQTREQELWQMHRQVRRAAQEVAPSCLQQWMATPPRMPQATGTLALTLPAAAAAEAAEAEEAVPGMDHQPFHTVIGPPSILPLAGSSRTHSPGASVVIALYTAHRAR